MLFDLKTRQHRVSNCYSEGSSMRSRPARSWRANIYLLQMRNMLYDIGRDMRRDKFIWKVFSIDILDGRDRAATWQTHQCYLTSTLVALHVAPCRILWVLCVRTCFVLKATLVFLSCAYTIWTVHKHVCFSVKHICISNLKVHESYQIYDYASSTLNFWRVLFKKFSIIRLVASRFKVCVRYCTTPPFAFQIRLQLSVVNMTCCPVQPEALQWADFPFGNSN
jgi:hypothetical protein